jgi:1-acyl-sn-glycerol-3-phosphate acyltransferase
MSLSEERLWRAMHSPLVATVRLLTFVAWIIVFVPFIAVLMACGQVRLGRVAARIFWRVVAAIVGLDRVVRGTVCPDRPALFVANHASYLDIIALGSLLPAAFVAKKEVGQWPVIGVLAKIGRTVLVDRRPRKSLGQRDEMVGRLVDAKESLILFPEGTSSDGNRVLPFKSALLSVAEATLPDGRRLPVQPISLAYTRLDGMPMGRGWRPFFAWYGDMDLAPHLWAALGLGRVTVEIDFHPVVSFAAFGSRKALADHCHDIIGCGVTRAIAGRAALSVEPPGEGVKA